jgi:hypothetical protein
MHVFGASKIYQLDSIGAWQVDGGQTDVMYNMLHNSDTAKLEITGLYSDSAVQSVIDGRVNKLQQDGVVHNLGRTGYCAIDGGVRLDYRADIGEGPYTRDVEFSAFVKYESSNQFGTQLSVTFGNFASHSGNCWDGVQRATDGLKGSFFIHNSNHDAQFTKAGQSFGNEAIKFMLQKADAMNCAWSADHYGYGKSTGTVTGVSLNGEQGVVNVNVDLSREVTYKGDPGVKNTVTSHITFELKYEGQVNGHDKFSVKVQSTTTQTGAWREAYDMRVFGLSDDVLQKQFPTWTNPA